MKLVNVQFMLKPPGSGSSSDDQSKGGHKIVSAFLFSFQVLLLSLWQRDGGRVVVGKHCLVDCNRNKCGPVGRGFPR